MAVGASERGVKRVQRGPGRGQSDNSSGGGAVVATRAQFGGALVDGVGAVEAGDAAAVRAAPRALQTRREDDVRRRRQVVGQVEGRESAARVAVFVVGVVVVVACAVDLVHLVLLLTLVDL